MVKTVFLAGASGAIGRRLAPLLVSDGWRVFGTTRTATKEESLRDLGVEPIVVDIFDKAAVIGAVLEARPEVVIHQLTDLPPALDQARMAEAAPRNAPTARRAPDRPTARAASVRAALVSALAVRTA